MKKLTFCSLLSLLVCQVALAQPKLAIAGVDPSRAAAKKFGLVSAPIPAQPSSPSAVSVPVNFTGQWYAGPRIGNQPRRNNFLILISKRPNGSYHADITNLNSHRQYRSDTVVCDGSHFRLFFQAERAAITFEGDFDPSSGAIACEWRLGAGQRRIPYELSHQPGPATPPPGQLAAAPTAEPPSLPSIDVILHSLDTQLVDHFQNGHVFSVVEDADLKQAVPLHGEEYNLKDPATLAAFKKAGIDYLLVPSLEDASDQTLDQAAGTIATSSTTYNAQRRVQIQRNNGNVAYNGAVQGSINNRASVYDKHIQKDQIIRLVIRCRLFDANTGLLLDSVTHSFATNRAYVALAAGNNMQSTSDLFDAASALVADWTTVRVGDAVFPIKVLDKEDNVITLNRGSQSGLHIGQTFDVFVTGKEIKDPTTGEVLGRDDIKAGRVAISSVREKFSKASVLDDKGITAGAVLRPPEN